MLAKKVYTREEVENLNQVYREKVKESHKAVNQINAKFNTVDIKNGRKVEDLCYELSLAENRNKRNELIFKAVCEIAEDLIRSEISKTFASDILSKFAGKANGPKTYEKVTNAIKERYNIEYVFFTSDEIHWYWHRNEQCICYFREDFIDGNNKFKDSAVFYQESQTAYPADLEEWAKVFLAKKEEHAKLLKELDEKIRADCEELEIGFVQLPHIQVNALR